MKKTFALTHPKLKYARQIESVKNDLRKYLKRERKKKLPEDVDFWDFDCKFGPTEQEASPVHVATLIDCVSEAEKQSLPSFYVEILAKPGHRAPKPVEPPALEDESAAIEDQDQQTAEDDDDAR